MSRTGLTGTDAIDPDTIEFDLTGGGPKTHLTA
jgi:hypothetical protein